MQKPDNDYVNYLRDFLNNNHQLFDRDILYISVGALGVTFSFIDKVVDIKVAHDKALLFCSWIFFALSILNSLLATHTNIIRIRKIIDSVVMNNEHEEKRIRIGTNKMMQRFRLTSIMLIMAGIFFLLGFVVMN